MKVSKIIAITAIVAVAAASNQLQATNEREEDRKAEEEYGYFGIPWSIPDWLVGLTIGVYGSLNARTRDGDCFSKWYDWGFAAAELSNYFTQPFQVKSV